MLATCICLNGSLLDQLSCTIVYLHNLFTCTFGRINVSVCLSVCLSMLLCMPLTNKVSSSSSSSARTHILAPELGAAVWSKTTNN